MENPSHKIVVELNNEIRRKFSEEDIKDLCFDLDVDYDALQGEGKNGKARELVIFMQKVGKLVELTQTLKARRPDIEWPDIEGATKGQDQALNIELLVNGVRIESDSETRVTIPVQARRYEKRRIQSRHEDRTLPKEKVTFDFRLEIGMHNATARLLDPSSFRIAIHIHTTDVSLMYRHSPISSIPHPRVKLGDGSFLYKLKEPSITFPDEWDSKLLIFTARRNSGEYEVCLILYTKLGTRSFPFLLALSSGE